MAQIDEIGTSLDRRVNVRAFSSHLRDYRNGIYPAFIANEIARAGLSGDYQVNIGQRIKGTSQTVGLRVIGRTSDGHSLRVKIHPPELGNRGCRFGFLTIPQELDVDAVATSLGCDPRRLPTEESVEPEAQVTVPINVLEVPAAKPEAATELKELKERYVSDEDVLTMILMEIRGAIDNIKERRKTSVMSLPQPKLRAIWETTGITRSLQHLNQHQISQVLIHALTKEPNPLLTRAKNESGRTTAYEITPAGMGLIEKRSATPATDETHLLTTLRQLKEKAEQYQTIRIRLEELEQQKTKLQAETDKLNSQLAESAQAAELFSKIQQLIK